MQFAGGGAFPNFSFACNARRRCLSLWLMKTEMMQKDSVNTWVEISESAYAANLKFFKRRLPPETEFSVVIKSNAYGHGMEQMAEIAARHGADSFCVHSVDEALQLRNRGFRQDVLILGPVPPARLAEVIRQNFRVALFNSETLQGLQRLAAEMRQPVRVHLKLETGTYRQGIEGEEFEHFLQEIMQSEWLKLEAVYTHFANIEDTTSHDYAMRQLNRFREMTERVRQSGFRKVRQHSACSAAILLFPETYFDMVRLGISQYGLWPSRETFVSYKLKHTENGEDVLRPVLSWKTRIGQVKKVPANQCIGYGCTYHTTRESVIAVLPVGYADGYDRRLSNRSHVLIRGKRAPLRGRVCMNLVMVDVTDIPEVRVGDEAVLLGRQGEELISADYLAELSGSINYEVVTRINWQIPRFVAE